MRFRLILYFITVTAGLSFLAGCSEVIDLGPNDLDLNYGCSAYDCHSATQLEVFPPLSGSHQIHIEEGISCNTCHYGYDKNPLHKNIIINGYNWITGTDAPGNIIYITPARPTATWSETTYQCSDLNSGGPGCHGASATFTWYN